MFSTRGPEGLPYFSWPFTCIPNDLLDVPPAFVNLSVSGHDCFHAL